MDPLSFGASLVTVIGLIGSAGKGLRKLRDLHHAPQGILDLLSELDALEAILVIAKTLEHEGKLDFHICRLQIVLQRLDALVQSRIVDRALCNRPALSASAADPAGPKLIPTASIKDGGKVVVSKKSALNFAMRKTRITESRAELAEARNNITAILSLHVFQQILRTNHTLDALSSSQHQLQHDMRDIMGLIKPAQTWVDFADVAEKACLVAVDESDVFYDAIEIDDEPTTNVISRGGSYKSLHDEDWSPPFSCRAWCRCSCHRRSRWNSPQSLSHLFGSLQISYSGNHLWNPPQCSLPTCASRQMHMASIAFRWPQWFLRRMLLISMIGVKTVIELPRVRPATDAPVIHSEVGDTKALHECFQKGLASPYDVDEHGWSYLHNASFFGYGPMVKYLLSKGADRDLHTQVYETPREKALSNIFQGAAAAAEWPRDSIDDLATVYDLTSWIQEQEFSRLHKIVLGLINGCLNDDEMSHLGIEEIDARDVMGRTPLWWSISNGSVHDTSVLMRYGASATAADDGGWGPLSMTIARNKHEHLRIMLATPGHTKWDWHKSPDKRNMIHMLATYGDSETVKLLSSVMPRDIDRTQRNDKGLKPIDVGRARKDWDQEATTRFEHLCCEA